MRIEERRAWEKHQRKNRIITIAESVFHRYGYEGTTLPAVAEAAGYNRRTLYLYFKDKEDLFLAVALRALEALQSALTRASTRENGLRPLAQAFFAFAMERPQDIDVIMDYEARLFNYHGHQIIRPEQGGDYRAACQQASETTMALVTAAIAKGVAEGRILSPLTPRQLMLILWGQLFGVLQILRMRANHFEDVFGAGRRQLFECFLDMIETGLASPPCAASPDGTTVRLPGCLAESRNG